MRSGRNRKVGQGMVRSGKVGCGVGMVYISKVRCRVGMVYIIQFLLHLNHQENNFLGKIFTSRICGRGNVFVTSVCLFVYLSVCLFGL